MTKALSNDQATPRPISTRPAAYEGIVSTGHSMDFASDIQAKTYLKMSVWSGKMDETPDESCPHFITLARHISGGRVERIDRPNQIAHLGQITLTPGLEQSTWRSDGEISVQHFYLDRRVLNWLAHDLGSTLDFEKDPPLLVGHTLPTISNVLDNIALTFASQKIDPLVSDSWGIALADLLIRSLSTSSVLRNDINSRRLGQSGVLSLCDFIEEHLDFSLSLDQLSKQANCSPYHLARSFKAATGMAPHQYVLERRVTRAREMLANNGYSLADIAYAVGFSSQAHMTDVFRKRLGVTPGAFRKEAAK